MLMIYQPWDVVDNALIAHRAAEPALNIFQSGAPFLCVGRFISEKS